jgi:hypothetical protein
MNLKARAAQQATGGSSSTHLCKGFAGWGAKLQHLGCGQRKQLPRFAAAQQLLPGASAPLARQDEQRPAHVDRLGRALCIEGRGWPAFERSCIGQLAQQTLCEKQACRTRRSAVTLPTVGTLALCQGASLCADAMFAAEGGSGVDRCLHSTEGKPYNADSLHVPNCMSDSQVDSHHACDHFGSVHAMTPTYKLRSSVSMHHRYARTHAHVL